ncbi:MAG: MBL fold metallo-hydrolase [Desulfurococcales archaeon]|nr:MBL fold metallo-hydrolase [Desulfurococcales archaeon]
MSLKLVVLADNRAGHRLKGAWAWSINIQFNGKSILFDAGGDPGLLEENASMLGVDLRSLDMVILSHHHRDHYGGLKAVADASPGITLYVPPGRIGRYKRLGFNVVMVKKPIWIDRNLLIVGPLYATSVQMYEISLALTYNGKIAVIVGCSHPGVDRIVSEALRLTGRKKATLVIGGFHSPPPEVLQNLASVAETICPTHCSGDESRDYLRRHYPEKFCEAFTGSVIEL